ncbi:MAG: relaxase domain-containing protein, partial [Gemmataceae bacterium]|nr:relaxase domain-containing protein [Gemmataceae bacterium]
MRNFLTLAVVFLAAVCVGSSVVRAYAIFGKGDYYFRETLAGEFAGYVAGEGAGEWHGPGLPALGLTKGGRVFPDDLKSLLGGRSPDGRRMVKQPGPGAKRKRQVGWEWVFSTAKDFDVVWALAPDPVHARLDAVFRDGVRFVLDYAAGEFAWTRRGKGGKVWERCLPVLALFHHSNSRLSDPNRHVHAVLPNAAPRPDGTTGFVVSRPWYAGQRACSALFDLYVAGRLTELGLAVRPAGFTYQIDGVPRPLVRAWSKRTRQIAEHLAGADDRSFRAVGKAARKDRPRPPRSPLAEMRRGWAADAAARGFDVRTVFGRDQRPSADPDKDARAAVREAAAVLGANRGTFTRLDLIARAAVHGLNTLVPPAAVLAEVDRVLARPREHGIEVAGSPRREPSYALSADRDRPPPAPSPALPTPDRQPERAAAPQPDPVQTAVPPPTGHEDTPDAATRPEPARPDAARGPLTRATARPAAGDAGPEQGLRRTTTPSAAPPYQNPLDRVAVLTEPVRAWVAARRAVARAIHWQWQVTTADLDRMVGPLSRSTGLPRRALADAFRRIAAHPRLHGLVVVRRLPRGQAVFTTARQRRAEARIARDAAALARSRGRGVKGGVLDRALRRMADRGDPFLSAFVELAGGRSRLALLDAPLREETAALLAAVGRTCRESGLRVRWAAPTAATAGLMAHQLRYPVQTVAALLGEVEKTPVGRVLGWMHRHQLPSVWAKLRAASAVRRPSDPLRRGDWVVVGATQRTPARELARLEAACRRSGARLVLVGSRTDLPAGPAWAFLTDRFRAVRYDPPDPRAPTPERDAAR